MIYDDLAEEHNIANAIEQGTKKGDIEFRETFNIISDIYLDEGVVGLYEMTYEVFIEWVDANEEYYRFFKSSEHKFNRLNMWATYNTFLHMVARGHFRKDLDNGYF